MRLVYGFYFSMFIKIGLSVDAKEKFHDFWNRKTTTTSWLAGQLDNNYKAYNVSFQFFCDFAGFCSETDY